MLEQTSLAMNHNVHRRLADCNLREISHTPWTSPRHGLLALSDPWYHHTFRY
jgi:hypothetical protein